MKPKRRIRNTKDLVVNDKGTKRNVTVAWYTKERRTPRLVHGGDPAFQEACRKAGIPATVRQLSKWKRKQGAAYAAR